MTPNDSEHYYTEYPLSREKFGLVKTCLNGHILEFTTSSGVFSAKRLDPGTRLLIESMILPDEGYILDVGCGYGAVGISAAKLKPKTGVFLIDINRRAVILTRKNAERNRTFNTEVRQGNLYEPVKELQFAAVLSNPPISAGMKMVDAIIEGAPSILKEKGTLQMVVRSKIGKKTLPGLLSKVFGNCDVLAIESGYRVLVSRKD
jgi:16S rRNA (guanine1207-N2)-methyltransferase